MINLLPPELKNQVAYAKRNSALIRLILTTAAGTVAVVLLLNNGAGSIDKNITAAKRELALEQKALGSPQTISQIKQVNTKLAAIDKINKSKHHYSAVLHDFAAALPQGASISNISLAGDGKPLKLNVAAKNSEVANQVKDSLLKSPRVASVDVGSINQANDGSATMTITVTFKSGQDK